MNKIVLNAKQKAVIQKYVDGSYSPFFSSTEDQEAMNQVLDMANELEEELDAYDESGDDLVKWFWEQYQKQEQQ
jgi:hypothetical protein